MRRLLLLFVVVILALDLASAWGRRKKKPKKIVPLIKPVDVNKVFGPQSTSPEALRFGAFNIQVFGVTKYKKAFVKEALLKIIPRYDLLLIQEIRDRGGQTIYKLKSDLNAREPDQSKHYALVVSERLGRSSTKEQYAFLYRPAYLRVVKQYLYKDPKDVFEREPWIVHFHSKNTAVSDFGVLAIHIQPSQAVAEINQLVPALAKAREDLNLKDFILAGDFNADCSYVTKGEMKHLKLKSDHFKWLIGDDADTTVAKSSCSYDRIVLSGDKMKAGYVPDSAKVFDFGSIGKHLISTLLKSKRRISTRKLLSILSKISDHYPVEMVLLPKGQKQYDIPVVIETAVKLIGRFVATAPDFIKKKIMQQIAAAAVN